ncbi:hypothetical protein DM02DRAFT_614878 [Periconia macrospinosa]|uniref:Nucleoporin Nup54 alpha-helical domain-containing protein n=1 Tax=Periconia macrospinosa TaxID=97972 RepID=A0A2V1DR34_9PLEO|nr:hypothetical protein DM02DRAFT_614878 [Periconia macrospinosa]
MSLFGNQPEKKTGTLFGSTSAPPGGLFGQSQPQATQQQNTGSLFGAPQPANTGGSLFGGAQSTNASGGFFGGAQSTNAGSSLFGGTQQQQQQQQPAGGLFAQSQQQPQQQQNTGGMFAQTQSQQQQPNPNNSLFGGRLQPAPTLTAAQAQQLQQAQQGLPQLRQSTKESWASSSFSGQREKSVPEQIKTIFNKWDPTSPECVFQHYFYNSVNPDEAAFYGPSPFEDERKWEEALANKPSPGSIPVLVRGFEEIAARIQYQSLAVTGLRTRLHEINNSLSLMKDQHELNVAQRISEARRKHIVHTQRILTLATKVQILRNRGYVMDQAEEELKKKLMELEKKTFDPVLGGRQEEIWARMSGVRERAHILEKETERLGKALDGQQEPEVLSEADLQALDKILKDYDKQLTHLKKEIDDLTKEHDEWEKAEKERKPPTRSSTLRR